MIRRSRIFDSSPSSNQRTLEQMRGQLLEEVTALFQLAADLQNSKWLEKHAPGSDVPEQYEKRISEISNEIIALGHSPENKETKRDKYDGIRSRLKQIRDDLTPLVGKFSV